MQNLSPRQKNFLYNSSLRKQANRFPPIKIANSGFDPQRANIEFRNKDIIKPLTHKLNNVTNLYKIEANPNEMNNKFAIGTAKNIIYKDNIPYIQPFKEYNFINRQSSHKILHRADGEKNQNEDKFPFLKMKSLFSSQSETNNHWEPHVAKSNQNNRNSVAYNIINFSDNHLTGKISIKVNDINAYHKQKGVSEFSDLANPYYHNFNKEYQHHIENNKHMFKHYNGEFSNLYDVSVRNGAMYIPFQRNNSQKCVKHNKTSNLILNNYGIYE